MALIWWEIALIVALNATVMAVLAVTFIKVGAPKLLSRAEVWMGGAIGRFMQSLSEQAAEEGVEGSSPVAGTLKLGGLQITPELLQTGMQLLKMAQEMGFIKGGALGGGGGGSGL